MVIAWHKLECINWFWVKQVLISDTFFATVKCMKLLRIACLRIQVSRYRPYRMGNEDSMINKILILIILKMHIRVPRVTIISSKIFVKNFVENFSFISLSSFQIIKICQSVPVPCKFLEIFVSFVDLWIDSYRPHFSTCDITGDTQKRPEKHVKDDFIIW